MKCSTCKKEMKKLGTEEHRTKKRIVIKTAYCCWKCKYVVVDEMSVSDNVNFNIL